MANLKNLRLIPSQEIFCLILAWFGLAGLSIYIVGLNGWLNPTNIAIICFVPLVLLCLYLYHLFPRLLKFSLGQKLLVFLILCQLALYSLGLFVPETGFDALWYHLPEALHYAQTGTITKIPGIMYSTMPRLGEMYYGAAFFTHSLVFVKLVAFLYAIFYILLSYYLARCFLSRSQSLLVVLTVNSLYLVAWQSSSAYVDLPQAVFQLGALLVLLKIPDLRAFKIRDLLLPLSLSAILMGFALSVKIQALIGLLALSVFLVLVLRSFRFSWRPIIQFSIFYILISLFVAAPWYLDNYLQSGHPLYPANTLEIRQNILAHVGAVSAADWFVRKLVRLPLIFWDLGTLPAYQLTPIIAILFPVFLFRIPAMKKNYILYSIFIILVLYLVMWWFLPPAESRYALPALPPLIILLFYSVFSLPSNHLTIKQLAIVFIFISLALNFALRTVASRKYLPVIMSQQSPKEYINSQTTDFNRSVAEKFYGEFWSNYP